MLRNLKIGGFTIATAGHDAGRCYVIINIDKEYVYLVDGNIRTLDRPKKKKLKHVNLLKHFDSNLAEKITNNVVTNEEIKRAIKLWKDRNSSKEVE
ncbi:MAG: hypothetical protein GX359_08590 [Clostridiales bacterium]|nr:hypothetical protein [Clostridiales bacterium]